MIRTNKILETISSFERIQADEAECYSANASISITSDTSIEQTLLTELNEQEKTLFFRWKESHLEERDSILSEIEAFFS